MNRLHDALAWLRAHERWVRAAPAVVAGLALLVPIVRNAEIPALPDHEVPDGFTPAPPPTTAPPGAALPALPVVEGTTTSAVPPNVGRARVTGLVSGPDGAPVAGATVRLERVVAGTTQVLDAVSGPDGRYDAAGIGGGRYRVRAFLPPVLAQPTGEVLYLRFDEERTVDLVLQAFGEPAVSMAHAPDPPLLDQAVNLAVRVTGRLVDADGVVRSRPVPGAQVQISASGGLTPPSPSVTTTDGAGQARFSSRCESDQPTQVFVTVRLPNPPPTTATTDPAAPPTTSAPPPPTTATFDLPACVDPATLTTTTTTPSTTPDGATSSSTSSSTTTTAP